MENIFSTFAISGQGLSVQRQRLSAVANNIANANTTKSSDGKPYQREVIVARGATRSPFDHALQEQITMSGTSAFHAPNTRLDSNNPNAQIVTGTSVRDMSAPRKIYDPAHPDANTEGYVEMPNVNIVTEMVEMISAQRSFEANTGVIASVKNIAKDSLEI
ncbi:MAG: flagellar basal body rod protein FlgC [Ignavibacteria bacterium]|nr:flagellar basal body rod protein FlgC [Ignavibacteria bacterium]